MYATSLAERAYISFTGTLLLQDDKTENKFGKFTHSYTMQQAVEGDNVTPLLYEERILDLCTNGQTHAGVSIEEFEGAYLVSDMGKGVKPEQMTDDEAKKKISSRVV